jgi:hypothetical protein
VAGDSAGVRRPAGRRSRSLSSRRVFRAGVGLGALSSHNHPAEGLPVWTPIVAGSPAAVSVKIHPERASLRGRPSNGEARLDNRLSFMDQALLLTMRATGRGAVVQSIWVYDDAIDIDELSLNPWMTR